MLNNIYDYEPRSFGEIVCNVVSSNQDAIFYAKTSKGLFIKGDTRWLIFLSNESFRGPLTINLTQNLELFNLLNRDDRLQIRSNKLFLPKLNQRILLGDQKRLWVTPKICTPFPNGLISLGQLKTNGIDKVFDENIRQDSYFIYLPILLKWRHNLDLYDYQQMIYEDILILINSIKNTKDKAIKVISNFLGKGRGLTPSGDDFIIGFLLMLNRWGKTVNDTIDYDLINQRSVEEAYRKTTTLSANLIECAANGMADERLISISDKLMIGNYSGNNFLKELYTYGSTSGMDSFIGMISGMLVLYGK